MKGIVGFFFFVIGLSSVISYMTKDLSIIWVFIGGAALGYGLDRVVDDRVEGKIQELKDKIEELENNY